MTTPATSTRCRDSDPFARAPDLGKALAVNDFSIDGARKAEQCGKLGDWVAAFLSSPGSDNAVLAASLRADKASWCGPLRLSFDELHRLAGPPDQPTVARLNDDDLETVEEMDESIDDGWQPPPLIVSYRDSQLVVEDGNHRIEGLRRRGSSDYWAVIGFDNDQQRHEFFARLNRQQPTPESPRPRRPSQSGTVGR
jgi:hypothetical protein